ncbi:unnamed protein product [Closterium sp. NIES-65]|nr:unnamed protein product [Closterium sp. NIES-65]
MTAVTTWREQLPKLLLHLALPPRNVLNFDETGLYISTLPRRTYGRSKVVGRKIPKERLTVGFLCNADGSTFWRPLIISKSRRPQDFRPDFDPEPYCYWRANKRGWMINQLFTHFIEQLNAAMYTESRDIVVLLDNASSHTLLTETAETEDMFGFRTRKLSNVRLVYLPPNTTCFTQPLDQGIIKAAKTKYKKLWLIDLHRQWGNDNRRPSLARYKPNMRDEVVWVHDSWMTIGARTVQRRLITELALGDGAIPVREYVDGDDNVPTCDEEGDDPLASEPSDPPTREAWESPLQVAAAFDGDLGSCESRRIARAACDMMIGYAKSIGVAPRDLTLLFDIRNPVVRDRLVRASPILNLNEQPSASSSAPRHGRVLPPSITGRDRLSELLHHSIHAVMGPYDASAEWMNCL